jgi:carbon-monoxide dehydrogenase small subunit
MQTTVNGIRQESEVEPRLLLVHFLRENLGLTGTRVGCDTSSCGACTVIMDGNAVKSCTVLAVQADGRDILTVEGLAKGGKLHPLQEAFLDKHGLQCGYCTPGMLMSAYDLLSKNRHPSRDEIVNGISGNVCRCTGYSKIVEAVQQAARSSG